MKNSFANKTQKLAADILAKHVTTGRISQAYFFTGEELSFDPESGFSPKEDFVYDFATQLVDAGANQAGTMRRLREDKHPDVLRLGADPEMNSIKIEAMRRMLEWVAFKPFEGARKVGILCNVQKLTEEAANAFLKTLEEAPGNTVFCLLSPARELVLETIRSRCFEVRFPEVPAWNPAAATALPPFREMLDNYSDLSKAELRPALDRFLENIRQRLVAACGSLQPRKAPPVAYLRAFETVCETKSALEANANVKLAVTNMVMQLRHHFKGEKGIL